ncbi:MAG TPA: formate/nitrite transporter family protein [Opitutaceae bacterium]
MGRLACAHGLHQACRSPEGCRGGGGREGGLCNWLVWLGVVLPLSSGSSLGKVVAAWIPVTTFIAQGFEHSVVNMFLIPTGMLLGAKVSVGSWWIWNQIPVTARNFAGDSSSRGSCSTGLTRPGFRRRCPSPPRLRGSPRAPEARRAGPAAAVHEGRSSF